MQLTDFDYILPDELIAKYPLEQRSASRMLHYKYCQNKIYHKQTVDLVDVLAPGEVLVFNNTKVIPARLFGEKSTGGKVELLVEKIFDNNRARVMIKSNRAINQDQQIFLHGYKVVVIRKEQDLFIIELEDDISISKLLDEYGHVPIPPYLNRKQQELDLTRYQTVYASCPGAIAAPTAGLHFDQRLLNRLQKKGIKFEYLTLHVGLGTFVPVKVNNIAEHAMHKEYIELNEEVCFRLNKIKTEGKRLIAVGTTVTRALESAYTNKLTAFHGETDIFIYPGYEFKAIDCLLTNFHLPKSTLLMLISAFVGRENILKTYQEAIANKYRFFSYGDLMYLDQS